MPADKRNERNEKRVKISGQFENYLRTDRMCWTQRVLFLHRVLRQKEKKRKKNRWKKIKWNWFYGLWSISAWPKTIDKQPSKKKTGITLLLIHLMHSSPNGGQTFAHYLAAAEVCSSNYFVFLHLSTLCAYNLVNLFHLGRFNEMCYFRLFRMFSPKRIDYTAAKWLLIALRWPHSN